MIGRAGSGSSGCPSANTGENRTGRTGSAEATAADRTPGIAETCNVDEYKLHYYGSLFMVNPSGVVPKGPRLDFTAPHGRG